MTVKTIKATIRTPDGLKSIIYTYNVLELLKNDNNIAPVNYYIYMKVN